MSAADVGEEFPAVKRGPGRPRKNTVTTRSEFIDQVPDDAPEEIGGFSGLFDEATTNAIVKIRVIRKDPNEGTVGYLEDPTMGEAEISERWGGSSYLVQAIDANGRMRKGAAIKIAGDPIFVSKAAEMQWRRSKGLPAVVHSDTAAPDKGMGLQEMLMFIQTQDQQRRTEEREHQERLRKLELEAESRRRTETVEADARARRDDEERERRRIKDDEDREARRRRDQAEAEQRQQQFMQQTIQMLQQSSNQALNFVKATAAAQPAQGNNLMDAVKTVVAIKEAFAGEGDGGGSEETVLQTLLKHGGEWINGLSTGIVGAIKEVKGGGVNGANAGAPSMARQLTPQAPSTSPLALLPANHPINEKVETLIAKLAAKGLDPIAAMDTIVTNVLNDVDKIPQQGAKPAEIPKPYVQGPVGVASVATAPTATATTVTEEKPKVVRLSFGKQT